jgi:predicted nucleotidyltransferase
MNLQPQSKRVSKTQSPKTKASKPKAQRPKPETKEEIIRILRERLPELKAEYHIIYLGLFGSFVRGEQTKRSDVDLLVEFGESMDLFKYIELEHRLSKIVGRKVDLVMKDVLKPVIGIFILREVIPI